MSDDTDAETATETESTPGPSGEPPKRDEVLAILGDVLREAYRKAEHGRVYDAENERVRQGWIRAAAYAAGQYRQLKRDEELADLDSRLTRLEAERGVGEGRDLDALLAAADGDESAREAVSEGGGGA